MLLTVPQCCRRRYKQSRFYIMGFTFWRFSSKYSGRFFAIFLLRMHNNGYSGASDKNSNISIRFIDPDFFLGSEISRFEDFFSWFFIGKAKSPLYFYSRFIWPIDLESVPRGYPPTITNYIFHHVWSWYDCSLLNYSVAAADTLRDLVTLIFDLLSLDSGHTWRVMWSTPSPSLKISRLSVLDLWVMTSTVRHQKCSSPKPLRPPNQGGSQ